MEERTCQIKWEDCFAILLSAIHTKYNGRWYGRQDLIFKTEYSLVRRKENTPFERWKCRKVNMLMNTQPPRKWEV